MTLLDICVLDAPILRQETTVLTEVTDAHRRLIDDMFETMYAARGIGLAATQVGRTERICVVDVDEVKYALVNPEIVASDGEQTGEEGCLSIPEIYGDVKRAKHVVVRALDRDGKPFEIDAHGSARALPAARDRSPARTSVHRLPQPGEAAGSDQEVEEAARQGQVAHAHH